MKWFDKWKYKIAVGVIATALASGTFLPPEAYKPLVIAIWCTFDKNVCELKKP